jgi:putative nucleotidyltransferase with HDIG domain
MIKHTTKAFRYFYIFTFIISLLFLYRVIPIELSIFYDSFFSLLFFLVILTAAQQLPVSLPFHIEVTVDFAVLLSIIIIFGSKISTLFVFLSTLITEYSRRKVMPFYKAVFNINLYVIMVGISSLAYERLGGIPGQIDLTQAHDIFRVIIVTCTYLIVNVILITIAMSLLENKRSYLLFFNNLKFSLPNYIALAPLGSLLAAMYVNIGILGVVLFFVPLFTARRSLQLYMDMRKVYLDTIQALATTIEAKDPYTHGHSDRVAKYSLIIAEEMNLSGDFMDMLKYAALLHDIGKIGIPEQILNKPGKLSENEFNIVKQHPELGASIVENLDFLSKPATFIKSHHERLNGSGYPQGLCGEDIPLGAAILAVADAFDAMTTDRPYRKAWSVNEALAEIEKNSGIQFKAEVVQALKDSLEKGRININVG